MNFSKWLLKKLGWKTKIEIDEIPDKCVICVAPHTSNWDFVMGKLVYWSLDKHAGFLIKKSWTVFPFSLIFKPMGAIPVDRTKKTSVTDQVVEMFNSNNKLQIAITPEGTRKKNPNWKKGFYYIALNAHVPIVLAGMDYSKKEMIFGRIFWPTGNVDKDMVEIQDFYKDMSGKNPENFSIGKE
ncbi:1-acyl-sn-glycerol-3-phosphate acyltransferase [Bacteroidales bacterium OttesenSCG-928-I21]|nr:1-acyl-sn-glycerol-3-phosphate acyltransferase [Bacteroidales bacterium OttesenSCG-928-I21]